MTIDFKNFNSSRRRSRPAGINPDIERFSEGYMQLLSARGYSPPPIVATRVENIEEGVQEDVAGKIQWCRFVASI